MKKVVLLLSFASIILLTSCLKTDPIEYRSFEDQLEIDIDKIETYLAENEITATMDESGIYYIIHAEGEGLMPAGADVVRVDYDGRLLNDKEFDSSRKKEEKPAFFLNQLISAWQLMLPLIAEGGSMTVYAPSVYCYGANASPTIPANSCLIFDVDLLEVNPE